jgi:proteasome lid subunit RPN8/RPN11
METLWGKVKGDALHIHAFMPIKHKGFPARLRYEDYDLDDNEEEALEHKLELLGTIHTHPNCLDCIFSETDMREVQEAQDIVMAVCAITQDGKGRRSCQITYWPAPRPMITVYL